MISKFIWFSPPEFLACVHLHTNEEDLGDIIKQVREVVRSAGAEGRCTNIITFTDPSGIGVVQFRSIAAKFGFMKKINSIQVWPAAYNAPQRRFMYQSRGLVTTPKRCQKRNVLLLK